MFKKISFLCLLALGIDIFLANSFSEDENNSHNYTYLYQFGEKGSNNGQFNAPHSIDVDKFGNVYVTDTGNNRVQKFTSDGKFILK
ncbi:MAG: hypothetical protein R3321_05480, partial [Nitrososphaeraceae archaeon]|nr:hypothetical protein [Nitrososphaeraceae archaeon]